jgi:hypothetical protein
MDSSHSFFSNNPKTKLYPLSEPSLPIDSVTLFRQASPGSRTPPTWSEMNDFSAIWGAFRPPPFALATQPCPLDGCPMFADFRVHGLNTTFLQCFHHRSTPTYRKRKRRGRPDFLWSLVALASLMRLSLLKAAHVAVGQCRVSGNPGRPSRSTHVRESPRTWGTRPGARLVSMRRIGRTTNA